MRARHGVFVVVLVLVCGGLIGVGAADGGAATNESSASEVEIDDRITDDGAETTVVVRLEDGPELQALDEEARIESLQAHADRTQTPLENFADGNPHVEIEREFWLTNAVVLTVDTEKVPLERVGMVDHVEVIHDNFAVESHGASAHPGTDESATVMPDSPSVTGEEYTYGLEAIGAPEAWDRFDTRGEDVRVAVLDTGVDTDHPDIELTEDGWAEFDSDGNEIDTEPNDGDGHGTHVSGTVAGGNANGTAIGVAPETELLHGKVLEDDGGSFAQIIGGMEWAVEEDADVVSMSLGAEGYYDVFIDPVENANDNGVLVVSSSGNDEHGTSSSPGNVYDVLSVGATDEDDDVAWFSSGETVEKDDWDGAPSHWPNEYVVPDVTAPGVSVESAEPGGGYDTNSGTSMAAPHVSGAIALVQSNADGDLEREEIEDLLSATAYKPDDGEAERYGDGRIDVARAIALSELRDEEKPALEAPESANVSETVTIEHAYADVVEAGSYEWEIDGEAVSEDGAKLHHELEGEPGEELVVSVTTTDVGGETTTATATIDIVDERPPVAELEANRTEEIEVGIDDVTLDASESTDNHEIESYEWDLDDGTTETTTEPVLEHTFADIGTLSPAVTVVDASGNENTTDVSLEVVDTTAPAADIDAPETSVVGDQLTLDASGSADNHEIESYAWEIDGEAHDGETVTLAFDDLGEYDVSLTVTDPSGNDDETSTTVLVTEPPAVSVTAPEPEETVTDSTVEFAYDLERTAFGGAAALEYRLVDADGDVERDWSEANYTETDDLESFVETADAPEAVGEYTAQFRLLDEEGSPLEYETAADDVTFVIPEPPTVAVEPAGAADGYDRVSTENHAIMDVEIPDPRHESATVTVTDKGGDTVESWELEETTTLEWNATDSDGEPVDSGEYELTVTAVDAYGNDQSASETVTVDTDAPSATLEAVSGATEREGVFYANESDELVLEIDADDGTAEPGALSTLEVTLRSAAVNYKHAIDSDDIDQEGTDWTATVDAEVLPDDGSYDIELRGTDRGANVVEGTAAQSLEYDTHSPRLSAVITDLDDETADVRVRADERLTESPTVTVENPDGTESELDLNTGAGEDVWTGSFDVGSGTYELTATGVDDAGNRGTDTANVSVQTGVETTERSVTIYNERTGSFLELNTTEEVSESFVTVSESDSAPHPTGAETTGVRFLTSQLAAEFDDNLANATIAVPVEELPGEREPDAVTLERYDEDDESWEEHDLELREVDIERDGHEIEGEYWVGSVDRFSTYGITLSDDEPPTVESVTPDDGAVLEADTESVDLEFEYTDDLSGVDPSAVELRIDGDDVTDAESTQITSSRTTYDGLDVDPGERYDLELLVVDHAGNDVTVEPSFEVAAEDEDDGDDNDDDDDNGGGGGGSSGGSGGGGGGGQSTSPSDDEETDMPEPTATIGIEPTPATVGTDVTFSGSDSFDDERSIVAYEWEIDGETDEGESITRAFDEPGEYDVSLTVRNDLGETDTVTTTVVIEPSVEPNEGENDDSNESSESASNGSEDNRSSSTSEPDDEPSAVEEDDSVPGFGVGTGLFALLLAVTAWVILSGRSFHTHREPIER